jgi:hypothetical protein
VIFSRWRPDTGGYDYFDSPSTRYGLGDDLPVPRLPQVSELGAASTDIGRPMPADARLVGSGPIARGMIAPMNKSGLKGLGLDLSSSGMKFGAAILVALGLGFLLGKARR